MGDEHLARRVLAMTKLVTFEPRLSSEEATRSRRAKCSRATLADATPKPPVVGSSALFALSLAWIGCVIEVGMLAEMHQGIPPINSRSVKCNRRLHLHESGC